MNKPASPERCLIVGIGNPLRGDDGVGPAAARAIEAWQRPGVRVLIAHPLTPEIAHDLAHVDRALLIDADVAAPQVVVEPLAPSDTRAPLGHHTVPSGLLRLTENLFGRAPRTWLMRIPASAFDAPDALSPRAAAALVQALEAAKHWLDAA